MDSRDQVLRLYLFDPPRGGLDRLRAALPSHTRTPLGLEIPLDEHTPEEILALCLQFGVTARATRIVDRHPAIPPPPPSDPVPLPSAGCRAKRWAMKARSETVHLSFNRPDELVLRKPPEASPERRATNMTVVKDVMTTDLVVVSPELSLRDLVELFASQHVSGTPVVQRGKVVGVVTLDDVASFQASVPPVPGNEPGEIGWDEEEPPGAVEGDEPPSAYFLDTWADVGADLVERSTTLGGPEWDLMGEHTVEEVMSRNLLTIGPEEPVEEAARLMDQSDVHRLIVTGENDRLLGIITTSDITRAVAHGKV